MKRLILSASLAVITGFCSQAIAAESSGEASQVFSCFYECKPGPDVGGIATWQEITTLMLVNQSNGDINATIGFLDGNHNIIAKANDLLSGEDLDEINVCRTLKASGSLVPQAGLIEVVLDKGGAYGWVKNLLGKFFVNVDEPFDGRVTAIAKTECRLVPPSVITPDEIGTKLQSKPVIVPILVEKTGDGPPPCTSNANCSIVGMSIAPPIGEYCAKNRGDCAGTGICEPKPQFCTQEINPVCGCDNKTYSNGCVAASAGVNTNFVGPCSGGDGGGPQPQ